MAPAECAGNIEKVDPSSQPGTSCHVLSIGCKIAVTLAKARLRFNDAWIPAFAGMTHRYHGAKLNHT
jgi:hypothetical protein